MLAQIDKQTQLNHQNPPISSQTETAKDTNTRKVSSPTRCLFVRPPFTRPRMRNQHRGLCEDLDTIRCCNCLLGICPSCRGSVFWGICLFGFASKTPPVRGAPPFTTPRPHFDPAAPWCAAAPRGAAAPRVDFSGPRGGQRTFASEATV